MSSSSKNSGNGNAGGRFFAAASSVHNAASPGIQHRCRVKFCGITSNHDALLAAESGADAIGLVFYPKSPRAVGIAAAEGIVAGLPQDITVTALFVDADQGYIREVIAALPVHLLQFHGSEGAKACALYNLPYMKALRASPQNGQNPDAKAYGDAFAILWDTYHPEVPGGSGECGDWGILPKLMSHRKNVLAGGLNPDNVALAIKATNPYAVDVSSGIETSPGIKCAKAMSNFIKEVSNAG